MNTSILYEELFNAGIFPWKYRDVINAYNKLATHKCNMWLFAKWVRGQCEKKSITPSAFPLEGWVNMYLEWQKIT
jgi:hypothetical protein